MKNSLQSVLDTVGRGVKAVYSATPPGQLASRVNQAATLVAPTLSDFHKSYDQAYQGVSSFVQKNPQITQAPIQSIAPSAYQTFQNNVRLASQPVKSIMTETPAAKFLYEKIGGPGVSQLTGPKTVGKYIAGNVESTLLSPALLPLAQGGQISNIFKTGANLKAAIRSGAGLSALTSALTALKGEQVKPEDALSSFAMGAVFGMVEPKPMNGLATTELATARKTLGKYGFELKDFSDPAVLKSKFRSVAQDLHPDKGGNAEEFKAFIDAFNKSTSAGLDSGWKLPNITEWIKNLWKKEEPASKGGILPSVVEKPVEVTTGAQGPILSTFPERLNKALEIKTGKTFETATKSQVRKMLIEGNLDNGSMAPEYIAPKPEIFSKIANSKNAISYDELSTKPALLYGGVSRGTLTDGYVAILDPKVSAEAYKSILESDKKKIMKELGKQNIPFNDASKQADEQIKSDIEKYKAESYPEISKVIPTDPGSPSFEQAYTVVGRIPGVVLSNGQVQTIVNADKYAYIKELFPNATFSFSEPRKPISVVENGQIKALIMPINVTNQEFPFGPEVGMENLTTPISEPSTQPVVESVSTPPSTGGEQVSSAKYILQNNTFKDFEIKGLLGLDPKYAEPSGIPASAWKQAAKELGITEKSFVEGTTGNFHIQPSSGGEIGGVDKPKYDYKSTQLDLPQELAAPIQQFAATIPPEKLSIDPKTGMGGVELDSHVTVLYGLDPKITPEQLQQVIGNQPPIEITLGKTSIFENPEYDVVKVDVNSPQLNELNKKIKDELGAPGETFKDYTPHITVAYLKKGEGKAYVGQDLLNGQTVTLNNLSFSDQNGQKITIPLAGQPQAPIEPATVTTEPQAPIVEQKQEPVKAPPAVPAVEPSKTLEMPSELPTLPKDLQGAKPTYRGTHKLVFESDLDKAGYIIANEKPSARDEDYLKFVMNELGVDKVAAREYGKQVVDKVAELAQYSDGGSVTITPILSGEKIRMASIPPQEQAPVNPLSEIPKETEDRKLYGFTKNVLKYDTAKDELKAKIQADIERHFRDVAHNPDTLARAQQMIDTDYKGTLAAVLDPTQRSEELYAAAELLMNKLQYEGDFDTPYRIELSIMEKAIRGGRESQILATWQKMTPDGRVRFAHKVVDAAKNKMGPMDRVINGTSNIEEAPGVSKQITEEFNKVNIEVVDEVLRGLGKKLEGKKQELPPEELLGKRVNRYVKSLQNKPPEDREKDPVQTMVNTLYNVARELLPDKTPEKQNPLEFVADAIKNREKYGAVWELAQKIVQDTFEENPEAIDLLDSYFAYIVGKPFSTKTLNEIVGNAIKDNKIDITNVVKDFYVDLQKRTGETLAYRLSEEAGLSDDDAIELEKYIIGRFDELTKAKKEQILANMMKEHPKLKIQEKTFMKKLLEFSNMGAFSDKKYYDLIAKKLNIPNVSDEMAQKIYTLTQEMQALPIGSEERKAKTQQVMNLISEQIPDTMLEIFDAYRKNNMLSSPRTQIRNWWDSALKGTVIVPSRLAVMAAQDLISSGLHGEQREYYMKMVPQYYKGYINSLPSAIEHFKTTWKGGVDEESPTLREMKFVKLRHKYPKLTWIGSAMEAVDQFNLEMIAQGYSAALQAGGMDQKQAYEKGVEVAKRDLYKVRLDSGNKSGQGSFLSGIDALTEGLMRGKSVPILGTFIDAFIPFVNVPVQFAKQTLEYSPGVGHFLAKQASKERQKEQSAKANLGAAATFLAIALAMQGRTTWETPKDKNERSAGYDANWKPYSIKIGSVYWPMQYFGPFFLALAVSAAFRYYNLDSPTAKTDTFLKKQLSAMTGLTKAYSNLTFLSNIGSFFKAVDGSYDITPDEYLANVASSLSPLVGLTRYLATLVDPVYRKSNGFWDNLKKNYPFLTKTLEAYPNLKGEPSKRNASSYFMPYDIGIENPEARYLLNQRRLQERYSKTMTFMLNEIGVPDRLTKGTQEYLDYLDSHEEAQYAGPIQTLKSKIEKLGSDEFKLYANKELSTEEKNAQFEEINTQQEELLKQVDELYQEARGIMGKKEMPGIFDQVEASNYAEDFKDLISKTTVQPPTKEQQTATIKTLQTMSSVKDKYKAIRDRYDLDFSIGKNDFENASKYATKVGIPVEEATYDWYSAQSVDERRVYIDSLLENKTGNEVIATLASLRKKSPGTGSMILTDQIINDLIDEGIITKSMGTKLKKTKLTSDQKVSDSLKALGSGSGSGSGGGTTKSDWTKLRSLVATRASASSKPIKIAKFKTPKITLKNLTITGSKLKTKNLGSVATLRKSLPSIAKIKIPKSFANVMPRGFRGRNLI